jgi:hypothetical protein
MYEVFRDRAIENGIYKGSPEPLTRVHRNFYDKYVRTIKRGESPVPEVKDERL